jgi:8-oxo-dGTP pyrophosphatase MutT (NUDIX family)
LLPPFDSGSGRGYNAARSERERMSYVAWLRERIGTRKVFLVFASAIIRDAERRILFQYRGDFRCWGLPGGVLEPGEALHDALVREVYEETGLAVTPGRLVGIYSSPDFDVTYPNGDEVQQVTYCFECSVTAVGARPVLDPSETLDLAYFAPNALPPTLPWYEAMIRDAEREQPEAAFRAGRPGSAEPPPDREVVGGAVHYLRRYTGPDTLIWPAASGCIRDERGRFLLQQRGDSGRWGMPGGAMELGERIDQTLVREIREETGLKVEPLRLIGLYSDPSYAVTYPDGNRTQVVVAFFDCRVLGGALRADGHETLALEYFAPDDTPPLMPRWRVRIEDALANRPEAFVR